MGDRGQAYTLEALVGTIILLTAVVFALNVAVVTPTTSGTLDSSSQDDLRGQLTDTLAGPTATDQLTHMLLYVNTTDGTFAGNWSAESGYKTWPTESFQPLGTTLDGLLDRQGLRYNVEAVWYENDTRRHEFLRYRGAPGAESVVVTRTVVLTDKMRLRAPNSTPYTLADVRQNEDLDHPINAMATDPDDPVYAVVELRVIAW